MDVVSLSSKCGWVTATLIGVGSDIPTLSWSRTKVWVRGGMWMGGWMVLRWGWEVDSSTMECGWEATFHGDEGGLLT